MAILFPVTCFSNKMPPSIEVRHRKGIYLPEPDLWLDPPRGKARAFVSHAHSDHFARHQLTICSSATQSLIQARYGKPRAGELRSLEYRQPMELDGFSLQLLPAGHILGSSMLHITRLSDGATLLYTGDFKLVHGLTAEPAELLQADTLIMETTFGLPHYKFPPRENVAADVLAFIKTTMEHDGIPVLLGYSLGKAQEILASLAGAGHPVMVDESIARMNRVFTNHGIIFPEHHLLKIGEAAGHIVIAPPQRVHGLRKLTNCRIAMLTGWALNKSAKYRYRVDEAFPLSDHADYDELLQCVAQTKPRLIYTVHGSTTEFARDLRQRGHEAWSLVKDEQRELSLA